MDFEVPLNRLKFGQEDGAGINARVTGRDDGIPELAANLHAQGQIENLIIKPCGDDFYSVANGNRRLAAFHMIYGTESSHPIKCTSHDVDEAKAFEFSLTTAVTAKQLHPVDQYEAFARLRDKADKTPEEIARQYGMTEREVEQALALGHLSPKIRDAWRRGQIKTDVAKAFTMAPDHKTQDAILDTLTEEEAKRGGGLSDISDHDVKSVLKVGNDNSGTLVEFVGIDVYVKRGGKVTRDLFGTDHKVSDPKLAKTLAAERLAEECRRLKEAGWSFALVAGSLRDRHMYSKLKVEPEVTEEEQQKLDHLNAIFNTDENTRRGMYSTDALAELTGAQQKAYLEYRELERTIELRVYPPKLMAKSGCFVDIDSDGLLEIEYGRVKPAQKQAAAQETKAVKRDTAKAAATAAVAAGKPVPESTVLSNALKDRLEAQLVGATRDAIADEPLLVNSPLFEILARVICAQIVVDRNWGTPDAVRTKLPSIRQTLNPHVFNAAVAKRFDAENYFSSAPKGIVLKAIAEGINPDEAHKIAGKTKAEIWKFALGNLGKTGWLPKELRTVHYAGPGSDGYKKPPAATMVVANAAPASRPATQSAANQKPPAKAPVKLAAASKKATKKTSAKKR